MTKYPFITIPRSKGQQWVYDRFFGDKQMSEKFTTSDDFCHGYPVFSHINNMIIGRMNSQENAKLVCRLLNEDEKRKSLPKIEVDYDDMISMLGILKNHTEIILYLNPNLAKNINLDFWNRMESKYREQINKAKGF